MRAAYFKGIRLWEACQHFPGWATRTGEHDYQGYRQTYKGSNPQSGAFERALRVRCVIEPKASISGFEADTSVENTLYAIEALLLAAQASLGSLCYSDDERKRASVTAGGAAGSAVVVTLAARAGGWACAIGDLVLFRKASTGAGFQTTFTNVAGNDVTADLSAAVDNTWEVILVHRAFASVAYLSMDGGDLRGTDDSGNDRSLVTYDFKGFGAVTVPSASLLAGYTT